jgi:glycosyltransferase involved in cell wall biosynthesis
MPGSIIEAFAAGTPVVTTNAGGIPYIVLHEETAMMVERDDAEALAACAMKLLEDEKLAARLVENACTECRKYAWESVREEWLKLYETVSSGRASYVDDASAVNAQQKIGDKRKTVGG